jgi:hypothetical protein
MACSTDPRENVEAFWAGQRPRQIPLTVYRMFTRVGEPGKWEALFRRGLVPVDSFCPVRRQWTGQVEQVVSEYDEGGLHWRRSAIRTPVGEIYSLHANGWQQKYMLTRPEDYRVMTYVAEHTRLSPAYDDFRARQKEYSRWGVTMAAAGRTPLQAILVDWAGLEQFSMHLFDFPDAVLTLYEAQLELFRRMIGIIAGGPGKVVSVLENFTAETMGPQRFARFHVPVYRELFPALQASGKAVGTHFDGKLASCSDLIGDSPIDMIESITPPPEGDMTLGQARAVWPAKLLWSNSNGSTWELPPERLRREVLQRVADGSAGGARLAFEISEDLPVSWEHSVPVVLEALRETRAG